MKWKLTLISEFLTERTDRFKPDEANRTWLYRLEKIDFSWKIYISENKPTKTNMILVKKWDLVISWINVEKWALSVYEWDNAILATIHYSSYKYNKKKINIEYLKYFLNTSSFHTLLLEQNWGGIKTEIKPKTFLKLKVFLPTLDEQEKILKKYNEFKLNYYNLSKISSNNINYIKNLKQSIIWEAIEWKLTKSWREQNPWIEPASVLLNKIKDEKKELVKQKILKKQEKLKEISKDEIPFEIPENWNWSRLWNICNNIHYWFNASANENKLETRLLRITDIQNDMVNWETVPWCIINENEIERYKLSENDILIARTGWTIWKSYIVKNIPVTAVFASYLIRLIPNHLIDADFIKKYLWSNLYWSQLIKYSWWAAQPNVNWTALNNLIFPLPPLEEQKEIVRIIDELTKFCNELESQTKKVVEKSEKLYKLFINNIWKYSEEEIKELLENSKSIEENIRKTVKNNLSFKNFEEFVTYIESLQKKEEIKEVKKTKKQVYNIKSSNMEILEILKDNKDGIDPLSLWQFSKHKDSIEDFYDELKKLAKEWKIKEEKWTKWDEEREIILKLAK